MNPNVILKDLMEIVPLWPEAQSSELRERLVAAFNMLKTRMSAACTSASKGDQQAKLKAPCHDAHVSLSIPPSLVGFMYCLARLSWLSLTEWTRPRSHVAARRGRGWWCLFLRWVSRAGHSSIRTHETLRRRSASPVYNSPTGRWIPAAPTSCCPWQRLEHLRSLSKV